MEITDKTEESLFSANDCVVFVSEIPSEIEIGKVFSDERNAEIASCRNENLKKARIRIGNFLNTPQIACLKSRPKG